MNRLAVALATTMAAAGIAAQASRPSKPGPSDVHGIRMDALSRKTLDRWQKLEYHLGRAGIDKLSMTIHFENDGSLGKHKVDGTYKFDGDKSTLAWKDTKMTGMLAERGLTVQMFERWIKPEGIRPELKDTKLTATPVDGGVKIAVDGKTTAGYRAFTFGADGVARSITLCGDEGEPESTIDLTYERVGTRHRASGWTSEFTHGGKAIRCEAKITYKQLGGFDVVASITETVSVAGKKINTQVMRFDGYKLDDSITEPASAKPTNPPKPGKPTAKKPAGSKPTGKPAATTSRPAATPPGKKDRPAAKDAKGAEPVSK